jgi:hypothetical protein
MQELKSWTKAVALSEGFLSASSKAGSRVVELLIVSKISSRSLADLFAISTVKKSEVSFNIELMSFTEFEIITCTSRYVRFELAAEMFAKSSLIVSSTA